MLFFFGLLSFINTVNEMAMAYFKTRVMPLLSLSTISHNFAQSHSIAVERKFN